ncbi:hypothetical protein O181_040862 [Austropuccinia psidii MF-1]|uniref:Uncharacterized protein n=1 Tax=Austropuccinia psidii MF-1 TaxID=1389203 RepID=A0A9Q3HEB5_9BASI|nr:hypothetical protein [Austropuccinia psidii MF-1]
MDWALPFTPSAQLHCLLSFIFQCSNVRQHHQENSVLVQPTSERNMWIELGMSGPMMMIIGTEQSLLKGAKKNERNQVFFGL